MIRRYRILKRIKRLTSQEFSGIKINVYRPTKKTCDNEINKRKNHRNVEHETTFGGSYFLVTLSGTLLNLSICTQVDCPSTCVNNYDPRFLDMRVRLEGYEKNLRTYLHMT